jgi:hypothetical protein
MMMQDQELRRKRQRERSEREASKALLTFRYPATTANYSRLVDEFLASKRAARVRAQYELDQKSG